MTHEQLAHRLQDVTGTLMVLETEALTLGEDQVARELEAARALVVRAGRRVEPPLEAALKPEEPPL